MARFPALSHAILVATALASLLSGGWVRSTATIGLDQIIFNNQTAMHASAVSNIRSMEVDLSMKDGKSAFDAVYMVTRDGRMRIDIINGGKRVYTEAYDGRQGWDLGEGGSAPTIDPNAAALWHGTQFPEQILALRDLATNGHKVAYIGRERIDGVSYYVLKITLSDGFETYRYINPESWLIERGRDFRAFHPAINDKKTWIETVWSGYHPVNGVMHPFRSINTDLVTGQWQATNTVKSIRINPNLDSSIFIKPTVPAP